MRQLFLHITTITLSTLILFGQVGVNLHSLYCACKDQWQSAFTQLEDDCKTSPKPPAAHSCCAAGSGCAMTAELPQTDSHPDCTKRSVQYLQQDLTATTTSLEQLELQLDLAAPLLSIPLPKALLTDQPAAILHAQESPPPRYGMALRRYLHSYLC